MATCYYLLSDFSALSHVYPGDLNLSRWLRSDTGEVKTTERIYHLQVPREGGATPHRLQRSPGFGRRQQQREGEGLGQNRIGASVGKVKGKAGYAG